MLTVAALSYDRQPNGLWAYTAFPLSQGKNDKEFDQLLVALKTNVITRIGKTCGSGPVLIGHGEGSFDYSRMEVLSASYPTYRPVYRTDVFLHSPFFQSQSFEDARGGTVQYSYCIVDGYPLLFRPSMYWWPSGERYAYAQVYYCKFSDSYQRYIVTSRQYLNGSPIPYPKYTDPAIIWSEISDINYWLEKDAWGKEMAESQSGTNLYFAWGGYISSPVNVAVLPPSLFSHREDILWWSRIDGMPLSPGDIQLKYFGIAFYKAMDKLPQASQNFFANLIEIISSIRSIMQGYVGIGVENLYELIKEAWLSYRYAYNTTAGDIKELADLVDRLGSLTNATTIKSYGSQRFAEGTWVFEAHCCLEIDASYFVPHDILSFARTIGLKISLTNIWDMIPYSFVVDWFLNVSSALEAIDRWLEVDGLPIRSIWYSFTSSYDGESSYGRWKGNKPSLPYLIPSETSSRTWWMRVADSISLFF